MSTSIKGVDLSVYQNGINHKSLAAKGIEFAIIRAGIQYSKDTTFEQHVNGCLDAGIDIGYYWFSYAKTVEDAKREAAECLKVISKFPAPKYPVFFDGEVNSIPKAIGKEKMTDIALAFIEEIERGGYPSGIYANPNWMENYYVKPRVVGKVDIWLAHWTWSESKPSNYNYNQTMWQWGIIQGTRTNTTSIDVDADICYVDYPEKTSKWYDDYNAKLKSEKTVEELAIEVLHGLWGNGIDRKSRLLNAGYDYEAVQSKVNDILALEASTAKKSVEELALEVIRGLWGNGVDRKQRLETAGYDYSAVQSEVSKIWKTLK